MRPDMNQQNERCTDLYEAILRLKTWTSASAFLTTCAL